MQYCYSFSISVGKNIDASRLMLTSIFYFKLLDLQSKDSLCSWAFCQATLKHTLFLVLEAVIKQQKPFITEFSWFWMGDLQIKISDSVTN